MSPGERRAHTFFSTGNQKERVEGKCFEIYEEVYYKTDGIMKILNII